jgi:hypothetical protein
MSCCVTGLTLSYPSRIGVVVIVHAIADPHFVRRISGLPLLSLQLIDTRI